MLRSILAAAGMALVIPMVLLDAASAQELVPCAREDDVCQVPYPTRVIYGVEGRTVSREVGGRGISCSNDVFGDPAPGRRKRCFYVARGYGDDERRPRRRSDEDYEDGYDRPRRDFERPGYAEDFGTWRTCSREEGFCAFRGRKRVRYGRSERWFQGVFVNGVPCTNEVFGDPVQGKVKSCQVLE